MKNWNTSCFRLLAAGTAILLTACASTTRPGLDGSDRTQILLISEAKVLKDSSSFYTQRNQEAARSKTLITSGKEYDRLARIMNRIVPHADTLRPGTSAWNWELVLIDSPEINANVLPGGKITFYTGIIRQLSLTDDEIAAVMGHEIAHALREHAREKISQNQVATLASTVIVKTLGGGGELVGMAQKLGLELPFSRAMESEADAYGLELAARAGYHPQGAITLWQKMSAQRGGAASPEMLSTHPSDETRLEKLGALQAQAMPLYEAALAKSAKSEPVRVAAIGTVPAAPLIEDTSKILDAYAESRTVDFGEGTERRIIHVARKKGQPWQLIVFAQRTSTKFQMTANQPLTDQPAKGLEYTGTLSESEEQPAHSCTINGKPGVAFGFMKTNGRGTYRHDATGKALVWKLDADDKPISLAKDKVMCKVQLANDA